MASIAFIIRELPYLKLLVPLMEELHSRGQKYNVYHMDSYKGNKEYSRPTLKKMMLSSAHAVSHAEKIKSFSNDAQLRTNLVQDKIDKLVSVEIFLWARGYLKELKRNNIKTYSLLYLSDSLWQNDGRCVSDIHRTYYSSKHLLETHHSFLNKPIDPEKAKFLGSTIYDPILNQPSAGDDTLILLPNMQKEDIKHALGGKLGLENIISRFAEHSNLIFKTRKKQWLPANIMGLAKEIIEDGEIMYPPAISDILKRTKNTVMFFSSGIYECVYGGNHVINVPVALNRWAWDARKLRRYFSLEPGSLYNFPGAVENVTQEQILNPKWCCKPKELEVEKRLEWVNKFIGKEDASGAKSIIDDILGS